MQRKKLELAELELSTDETNIQLKANVTNALTELAEVEERITSQSSEQKRSQVELEKEVSDVTKEGVEKNNYT